jgi:hypothetical protein
VAEIDFATHLESRVLSALVSERGRLLMPRFESTRYKSAAAIRMYRMRDVLPCAQPVYNESQQWTAPAPATSSLPETIRV